MNPKTNPKRMNILEMIVSHYGDDVYDSLKADGFDDAVIGIDDDSMRLIYSEKKAIEILAEQMDWEDAEEFFDYNVKGTKHPIEKKPPIWCNDNF